MTRSRSKPLFSAAIVLVVCACGGGGTELSPELTAQLDEYENLIDEFEPKFAAAKDSPSEFAKVADSYSQKTLAWMGKWETVAPNPSDEEGKAIKARIDKLNKRAERMLRGSL